MVCLVCVLCYFLTVERYIFFICIYKFEGKLWHNAYIRFISSNCNFSSEGDSDFVFYL